MRFTILPFVLAMVMAISNMPTDVYQICAWNHGTEKIEPWRARLADRPTVQRVRAIATRMREWCAELTAVPLVASEVGEAAADLLTVGAASALNRRALRGRVAQIDADIKAIGDAVVARGASASMTDEERTKLQGLKQAKADTLALLTEADEAAERDRSAQHVGDADASVARTAHASVQVSDRSERDPKRGFRNLADFALSVRNACTPGGTLDQRLAAMGGRPMASPTGYMQEGNGAAGEGYEVPAEMRQNLFSLAFPADDLLMRVNPEPTGSNAVDIDGDETTPWGSTGVQAYWRGQGAQFNGSKLNTNKRVVRLNELYAMVLAEEELLQDAPRLNDRLTNKSALAIRYKAAEALVNGTGAGQPLGWMKAACLVTVAAESAQVAATIVAANVLKMYSRLLADGGAPFWLANRDTLPQLAVMTIGQQPIWTPPVAGMQDAPAGRLLGLPIVWSEHADTCGTKGDLQLVNPVGYYAAIKAGGDAGIQYATSIHLYFDYAVQAFRWIFRLGGQPYLSAAVAAAKGSNTKSHFVALATRP